MRYAALLLWGLIWAQSPSWGRAQIDSARSIIPRYVVSPVAQPQTRVPYFAILRVTGLEPNTTYRFVSRMDNVTTPPVTNNINLGAGNPIFYNPTTQTYTLTNSPTFATAGGYGTVLTDANGEATLIFGLQPTGNQRFRTDNNNKLYVKVFFQSDNTTGPIDSAYVIGDKTPIQPLALRTFANSADTTGSFFYDSSLASAKALVFLYDAYGPRSIGERPLAGAVVENAGLSWGASQLPAYISEVSGRDRRYGTVIPNSCTGVKAIHYVNPDAPGLYCEQAIYDLDGNWPSGISTVAPTNGAAPLGLVNSPYYPLLPDPGNGCLNVSSTDINPMTGSVYVNYTILPTSGFLYGLQLYLGSSSCSIGYGPQNLPLNIPSRDSTNPMMPYVYGLCRSSEWYTTIDSIRGSQWPGFLPSCEPCAWYQPVTGRFIWRCMRGEGGFAVQNFTYYGDESSSILSFYSTASVSLAPRRVPRKVVWVTTPPLSASPGDAFTVSIQLEDSLTPATWGAFPSGQPNFSSCTFGSAIMRILDASGNVVGTATGTWNIGSTGMPSANISGTWPSTPGQYVVFVEEVPFPFCSCTGPSNLRWQASDFLPITISNTGILIRPQAHEWVISLPQAGDWIALYDMKGHLIWESVAPDLVLNIPRQDLPKGIYTVVLRTGQRILTQKVVQE
ncbi:MAG: T9SS type A sorting domain-containing protein [Bacteroidia bacterium]|nr:T9SS type A sorting domain-containing protein [Bacteroidia bacterium]